METQQTSHASPERCQLLRSRVLHRQNATMVTSASPGHTTSPPTAFRSPPQDAKSVPGDFGPLSLYLTPGACGDRDSFASGSLKGPDLPPAVLRAKSFHLLLGQTPLEMTAECGPRKDRSV